MTASSTATIGSYELTSRAINGNEPHVAAARDSSALFDESRTLGSRDYADGSGNGNGNGLESVAAQTAAAHVELAESWKYPRENVFKTSAAFWSLLTSGANDAAYGVSFLNNPLVEWLI
jgi:hypothetical protein